MIEKQTQKDHLVKDLIKKEDKDLVQNKSQKVSKN